MLPRLEQTIVIHAPSAAVWDALTIPSLMVRWMGEPEMKLEVHTDWRVGGAVVTRGHHHVDFESRGVVLVSEARVLLRYTHLSSISRLPDVPESYTTHEFRLTPVEGGSTSLTLALTGFPTESIFKHLEFYWRGTLKILKRFIEERAA